MGLDMYLSKRSYVKNWEHNPEKNYKVNVRLNNKVLKHVKPERVSYIIEDVGYWRKANAIHNWFVNNVQDGKDDCDEYRVEPEKLFELQGLCEKVLNTMKVGSGTIRNGYQIDLETGEKTYNLEEGEIIQNPDEIAVLLPSSSGFFFGSTDYDQWYIEDILGTLKILDAILAEVTQLKKDKADYFSMPEFYYRASW